MKDQNSAVAKDRSVVELKPRSKGDEALVPSEARLRGSSDNSFRLLLEEYIRCSQFKRLLNQVATSQAATGISSVAVLSYERGEGKSFFTSALALGYAKFFDSRVLILDTNRVVRHRSPMLEAVAGNYPARPGLGNANQVNEFSESVFVDLLTTEAIEPENSPDTDFFVGPYINSIRDRYDLILVDTSAIRSNDPHTIDPIIVANQVDSSILLTSRISVNRSCMEELQREMQRLNLRLMGTVFNAMGAT